MVCDIVVGELDVAMSAVFDYLAILKTAFLHACKQHVYRLNQTAALSLRVGEKLAYARSVASNYLI